MASGNVVCGICGQARSRDTCKVIKLTQSERQVILDDGQKPLPEYIYCRPCWRVLSNPVTGPNLGKGLMQARLRQLGVVNAEALAKIYHKKLVSRIVEFKDKV